MRGGGDRFGGVTDPQLGDLRDPHDIAAMREEYAASGLDESDLAGDPFTMFDRWFAEARDAGLHEPNAMVLATVSAEGRPAARTVLLKGVDTLGFRFFTNTASRKGTDLAAVAACSLLFPWHPLERQVRVDGVAEPLHRDEVAAYFASRPRGSRLGAWASDQSRPVASRADVEQAWADAEARFEGVEDVPVPPDWGGYLVRPWRLEFWQGRRNRLHDRLVYERDHVEATDWGVTRLNP
jgi:pyridoxamine 5'-phosphate oxidase